MKVDGKALIKRLSDQKGDRKKVSLYLSDSRYKAFKKECDKAGLTASVVMEELMGEFLESLKTSKTK